MRGDVAELAIIQATVTADVCSWSNAAHFVVCPTYYSFDPVLTHNFGPPPRSYLRDFGRSLDPHVDLFWTGEKVISQSYSAMHLSEVETELRRKPFIWDNQISNDSKPRSNHLFFDPATYTWELPADLLTGIAINPMNQAYL
jgi:hyaluronoglucosaminidase